jgi:hypothetical protein
MTLRQKGEFGAASEFGPAAAQEKGELLAALVQPVAPAPHGAPVAATAARVLVQRHTAQLTAPDVTRGGAVSLQLSKGAVYTSARLARAWSRRHFSIADGRGQNRMGETCRDVAGFSLAWRSLSAQADMLSMVSSPTNYAVRNGKRTCWCS